MTTRKEVPEDVQIQHYHLLAFFDKIVNSVENYHAELAPSITTYSKTLCHLENCRRFQTIINPHRFFGSEEHGKEIEISVLVRNIIIPLKKELNVQIEDITGLHTYNYRHIVEYNLDVDTSKFVGECKKAIQTLCGIFVPAPKIHLYLDHMRLDGNAIPGAPMQIDYEHFSTVMMMLVNRISRRLAWLSDWPVEKSFKEITDIAYNNPLDLPYVKVKQPSKGASDFESEFVEHFIKMQKGRITRSALNDAINRNTGASSMSATYEWRTRSIEKKSLSDDFGKRIISEDALIPIAISTVCPWTILIAQNLCGEWKLDSDHITWSFKLLEYTENIINSKISCQQKFTCDVSEDPTDKLAAAALKILHAATV